MRLSEQTRMSISGRRPANPGLALLTAMDGWWDARDIVTGSEQWLPNRGSGGTADLLRGATTGSEGTDPAFVTSPPSITAAAGDYMQVPAGFQPTTGITGVGTAYTVLICLKKNGGTSTQTVFSAESAQLNGINLYLSSGATVVAANGAGVGNFQFNAGAASINDNTLRVIGGVWRPGDQASYTYGVGLDTFTSVTSAPTHSAAPRFLAGAYSNTAHLTLSSIYSMAIALGERTAAELNLMSAELIAAHT